MIKFESLSDYLKSSPDEFMNLAKKIYDVTSFLSSDYPNRREWYFTKQLPGISSDERNIIFARNPENFDEIIAIACLKKNEEEKKICTLYVSDKFRNFGIGTSIIGESMQWLGTTKPLVTLADYKLDMFRPIIEKYEWQLTEIASGLYNDRSEELCFNGTVTKGNDITPEKQLQKKLIKALNKRIDDLKQ